jgi:serine/threonine-protein kinase
MPSVVIDHDPNVLDPTPSPGPQRQGVAEVATYDPLVGTLLAERYEIIRRIGEGGMGAVYEGRHSIIGKRVAIKVLLEKFLENEEFIARLLQEARLASSIGHPNIVDVTDFGTTRDGRAFVVMEYLEGEPLAALVLRDAPLSVERSLYLIKQVASALGAAHAKGIVHRDVKPENVYLVRRGDQDFVKVVDFGVSKAVRAQEDASSQWQRLTRTGAVLGTPLFMSPEQASGQEDIDERADVWATGLMLYECLTGELPFRANNYLGVLAQIQKKEPMPPSVLRPELGIPEPVDRVVMMALQKNRQERFQTMAAFERELDHLLAGEMDQVLRVTSDPSLPPVELPKNRWRWYASLVLGMGMTIALILVGIARSSAIKTSPPKMEPSVVRSTEPTALAKPETQVVVEKSTLMPPLAPIPSPTVKAQPGLPVIRAADDLKPISSPSIKTKGSVLSDRPRKAVRSPLPRDPNTTTATDTVPIKKRLRDDVLAPPYPPTGSR